MPQTAPGITVAGSKMVFTTCQSTSVTWLRSIFHYSWTSVVAIVGDLPLLVVWQRQKWSAVAADFWPTGRSVEMDTKLTVRSLTVVEKRVTPIDRRTKLIDAQWSCWQPKPLKMLVKTKICSYGWQQHTQRASPIRIVCIWAVKCPVGSVYFFISDMDIWTWRIELVVFFLSQIWTFELEGKTHSDFFAASYDFYIFFTTVHFVMVVCSF